MVRQRIIHLSQTFLPGGGGLENSINANIRASLSLVPYDLKIITISNNDKVEQERQFDQTYPIPIYRQKSFFFQKTQKLTRHFNSVVGGKDDISLKGKLSMLLIGLATTSTLFHALSKQIHGRQKNSTIIHCYSLCAIFVAHLYRSLFGHNNISILMGVHFIYRKSNFKIVDFLLLKVLKETDHFMCISTTAANALQEEFNIPKNRITVAHNWISLNEFPSPEETLQRKTVGDPIRIVSIGRIVPEKGVDAIIKLAQYIDAHDLSRRYLVQVIGDSKHPIKKELEGVAKNIGALEYIGRKEKPDLWSYYTKNHISLILSTWEEAFGRTIIESYACGTPVLGSNIGAIPEVLQSFSCYGLIDDMHPKPLLDAIETLVKNARAWGPEKIYRDSREVISKKYSEANFTKYAIVYGNLFKYR